VSIDSPLQQQKMASTPQVIVDGGGGAKKRKMGAPATAGKGTRRRLEGYGGDSGAYYTVSPNTSLLQWKTVTANQPVDTSHSLQLEVRAAKNELIRVSRH
jgi:hypothetical protein